MDTTICTVSCKKAFKSISFLSYLLVYVTKISKALLHLNIWQTCIQNNLHGIQDTHFTVCMFPENQTHKLGVENHAVPMCAYGT